MLDGKIDKTYPKYGDLLLGKKETKETNVRKAG